MKDTDYRFRILMEELGDLQGKPIGRSVEIKLSYTPVTIGEMMEQISNVLVAWGFSQQTIEEMLYSD